MLLHSETFGDIMKRSTAPALAVALLLLAACTNTPDAADPNGNGGSQISSLSNTNPTDTTVNGDPLNGPGTKGEFTTQVGDTVTFETDSYTLTAQAQATLQKQAGWLTKYPQHTVTIEGHADERGTREYNLALGDRRAQTVVNYLTALGVDANRIKEVSYGKEKPICPDSTEACWAQNRRGVTALDN
jgi:peptidoglycan-associated lipoprotein